LPSFLLCFSLWGLAIIFFDSLPKTASGKIQKTALRDRYS